MRQCTEVMVAPINHIIVITDNPEQTQLVQTALQWVGLSVEVMIADEATLTALQHHTRPVALVLDLQAPAPDLRRLCQWLKANLLGTVPMIVLVDSDSADGMPAALPADDILCRGTFTAHNLIAIVRSLQS